MGRTRGLLDWGLWWWRWRGMQKAPERAESPWKAVFDARKSIQAKAAADATSEFRKELSKSEAALDVLDFGAGCPPEGRQVSTTVGDVAKTAGTDRNKALWLRAVVESARLQRPEERLRVLEVGTNLGLGALSMLHATNGEVDYTGLEGSPTLVALAEQDLAPWAPRLVCGPFSRTLPEVMRDGPLFDVVFLDGHHEPGILLAQWADLQPALQPGSWVVVDDIRWSRGMHRAWCDLATRPGIRALDLFRMGILVLAEPPMSSGPLLRVPTSMLA